MCIVEKVQPLYYAFIFIFLKTKVDIRYNIVFCHLFNNRCTPYSQLRTDPQMYCLRNTIHSMLSFFFLLSFDKLVEAIPNVPMEDACNLHSSQHGINYPKCTCVLYALLDDKEFT